MKKSPLLTGLLLLLAHYGWGQNCGNLQACNSAACGSAFVTYSPVGDNVFCEGSVITLNNTSNTTDFEVFYIDWGDGQTDTVTSYAPVTHTYDYSGIDRCAEGPSFTQSICYIGSKTCANGVSGRWRSLNRPWKLVWIRPSNSMKRAAM